jgi:hypothetical protein
VAFTVIYALRHHTLPRATLLFPFVYWGGLYVALFAGFVARSWYGVRNLRRALVPIVAGTSDGASEPVGQLSEQV